MSAEMGQIIVRIGDCRAAPGAGRVVAAAPQEQAVGIGSCLDGTVIGVAQRERLGQRELERNVLALEMSHRTRRLGSRPRGHAPVVPRELRVFPVVRGAFYPHQVEIGAGGQVKRRQQTPLSVLLFPHAAGAAIHRWQGNREPVGKAVHTGESAEIMIEAAVLLHQDHHVIDVADRAAAHIGCDFQCARDGRGQRGGGACGKPAQQEATAIRCDHGSRSLRMTDRPYGR